MARRSPSNGRASDATAKTVADHAGSQDSLEDHEAAPSEPPASVDHGLAGPAADGEGPEDAETEYTVDELAAAAGLPVRTVRHYQSEKVLQPPERRGRVAFYRGEHLDRLRLIARLQDRGLQLSAIRDALKRVEKGELWLDDWLGLGEELSTPWSEERPDVLTEEELTNRLDDRPGLIAAMVDAGLVQRQGGLSGTFLVRSPGLLDIALQLDAAGVDIETAAGAAAIIRQHLRRATEELVDYSLKRAGEGFARTGSPEDFAEALSALRPLGGRAVFLVFAQEMDRALRHTVEKGRATPPPSAREDPDRDTS